jgi:tRNA pseudouridine38-40 synthase
MVRAVVGTLVEVGRGKLTIDGFREVIERRNRCAAGMSMPAGPLFLHEVKYPYYDPRSAD